MFRVRGLADGVEYHQFFLRAGASWRDATLTFTYQPNLLEAADGVVCIQTGIAMGVVDLEIRILDEPPGDIDNTRAWEAVAEASVLWQEPAVSVGYLEEPPEDEFTELLLPRPRSWYRIRAHACGRHIAADAVVSWPRGERHLIQVWAEEEYRAPTTERVDEPGPDRKYDDQANLPEAALDALDKLAESGANDLADAVLASSPEAQRSSAEWAAMTALSRTGLAEEPIVRSVTRQFDRRRAVEPSTELGRFLEGSTQRAASALAALQDLPTADLHRRILGDAVLARPHAVRALQALSIDNPLVAALTALAHAVNVFDSYGLQGQAFAAEAERLLKIWPSRWQDHARPLPEPPAEGA